MATKSKYPSEVLVLDDSFLNAVMKLRVERADEQPAALPLHQVLAKVLEEQLRQAKDARQNAEDAAKQVEPNKNEPPAETSANADLQLEAVAQDGSQPEAVDNRTLRAGDKVTITMRKK